MLARTRDEVERIKAQLTEWLAPRGLAFNEVKTKVVHLDDGFDFLGFNVRRYPNGKLLIKPSPAAVMRFRKRLRTEMRALRGGNAAAVIARLNPILRGWAAYYRIGVAKDVFSKIDNYLWWLTFRWAVHSHRNKSKKWVAARYYGRFHPTRRDRWVFGDRGTGAYLIKIAWTPIVRHYMVASTASPDDPELVDYRRRPQAAPDTAARPAGLDPTATSTRILSCMRRSAAPRRHRTPDPGRVGDVDQDGAQGGPPPSDHRADRNER